MIKRERLDVASAIRKAGEGKKLFQKGREKTGGRVKGQKNKTTKLLKEAIIEAAVAEGRDGHGRDGLVGFLRTMSRREPVAFMKLMEKLLPYQLTGKDGSPMQMVHTTKEQVVERFKERGLPLPPSLLEMPAHGEGEDERPN